MRRPSRRRGSCGWSHHTSEISVRLFVKGRCANPLPLRPALVPAPVCAGLSYAFHEKWWKNGGCCGRLNTDAGGGFVMITIENCLPPIIGWVCSVVVAVILENLCSCYFPFLLSSKFYYRVRNKKLQSILISPRRTRSKDSETAPEDRNKLPLLGCVYCIVVFLWLLSELIIVLLFLILNISKSNFVLSPFMNILKDICFFLFTSHYFWIFIAGMPLLYMIDYSLGLCRWQKR